MNTLILDSYELIRVQKIRNFVKIPFYSDSITISFGQHVVDIKIRLPCKFEKSYQAIYKISTLE